MPEIPVNSANKRQVPVELEGTVITVEYCVGSHSKASMDALDDLMSGEESKSGSEFVDKIIDGLLGFRIEWNATAGGVPIPTTREALEHVDGGFLYLVLTTIIDDSLPKENAGENSASGTPQGNSGSGSPRRERKKKQGSLSS